MKVNCRIPILTLLLLVFSFGIFGQETAKSRLGGTVIVTAPNASSGPGVTILIPISVDTGGNELWDHQYDLLYDPAILTPTGPNNGCVTAGAMTGDAGVGVTCFISPVGRLNLATASSSFVQGSGTLMFVRFAVAPGATEGAVSPLTFTDAFFFDLNGTLPGSTVNGSFTVLGPTSANVEVSGQVLDLNGMPIRNTRILFIDEEGTIHNGFSNQFGFYNISGLRAGNTYIVTAAAKGRTFKSFSIDVVEDISGLNIFADN